MAGTPRERLAGAFDRLSTSYKLLILLSLSLLPITLIALLASYQASRTAADQRRMEYTALAEDAARNLGLALAVDRKVVGSGLSMIGAGSDAHTVCARMDEVMRSRYSIRPFAVFGPGAAPICASHGFAPSRPNSVSLDPAPPLTIAGEKIVLTIDSGVNGGSGVVAYDVATLARINRAVLRAPGVYGLTVEDDDGALHIANGRTVPQSTSDVSARLSNGLVIRLTTALPGASASEWLLALLPILMWLAAALIGFLVVDRALLRPLETLRADIAGGSLGAPDTPRIHTPAHEIRDLADALTGFAREQGAHDRAMTAALDRQTALTREVHHRVKNNLQVIASLISLHARSTQDSGALDAFAAIQRRVDALAIVHRNHYAQLDEQGALELKPVLSELTANLLTNLPGARIAVQLPNLRVLLDTATALTFLVTEFVELSTLVDVDAPITIDTSTSGRGMCQLVAQSRALVAGEALDALVEGRYGRIMNGLVRQLRTELKYDPEAGSYTVEFPTLSSD